MFLLYKEYGDKTAPLMIFLHGGGISDWMWDNQIQYFTHYHCIVPILPEHGMDGSDTRFSIKGSAVELIKLIEEKAGDREVILIGFSLGAQVIIQLLSMKPEIIHYSMINSASVRPIPYARHFLKPAIKLTYPLIRKRWFSKLQAKTLYINNEDDFEKYYAESRHIKLDTLVRVLEENMAFGIPAAFSKAAGSILVTVGEKEKSIMKESAKDIIKANSNCTGVIIPGIGHGAPLGMPDFFNRMIEGWIQYRELPDECKVITRG